MLPDGRKRHKTWGSLPVGRQDVLCLSLTMNFLLCLALLYLGVVVNDTTIQAATSSTGVVGVGNEQIWHGGHPADDRRGSCWCGADDQYCMCTPNVAIDLIILTPPSAVEDSNNRNNDNHHNDYDVWLVRRKDTNQLATMGGFVDVNETVEHAVQRELKEEMGVDLIEAAATGTTVSTSFFFGPDTGNSHLPIRLVGVYSDPRRDNRRRNVSIVYAIHLKSDIHPQAGDDAKEVIKISLNDVEKHEYFSDHRTILLDYRAKLRGEASNLNTQGDFAADVYRSTC